MPRATHSWAGGSLLCLAALSVGVGACSDDQAGACVESLELDCSPLYQPVFDEIYSRTIVPKCAVAGGACHAPEGNRGGLSFESPDQAHRLLTSDVVIPTDAECSSLVKRIEGVGGYMPPGSPLDPGERCVLIQWVAQGAQR